MTEPLLYSFRRCPYAMRARMALLVSGTPFRLVEVKLSAKPADMIAASPKGTVPVLVLSAGNVIDESLDIMRWALARHDPDDWLSGDERGLIETNDSAFKHHLDRYKYPARHDSDPVEHRAAGLAILASLDDRLSRQPYLCGGAPALTDAALMPFVRQFAATDQAWFDRQPIPHLQRWLKVMLNTVLFEQVMARSKPD